MTILHPNRSNEYFTDDAAWEYVADQLEEGVAVRVTILDKPAGKKGYVMHLRSQVENKTIYVKLQMLSDKVAGRSFHISYD